MASSKESVGEAEGEVDVDKPIDREKFSMASSKESVGEAEGKVDVDKPIDREKLPDSAINPPTSVSENICNANRKPVSVPQSSTSEESNIPLVKEVSSAADLVNLKDSASGVTETHNPIATIQTNSLSNPVFTAKSESQTLDRSKYRNPDMPVGYVKKKPQLQYKQGREIDGVHYNFVHYVIDADIFGDDIRELMKLDYSIFEDGEAGEKEIHGDYIRELMTTDYSIFEDDVPILTPAPHSGTQESPEVDIDKEKKEVYLDEDEDETLWDVDMDEGSDEVNVQILTHAKHSVTEESFEEYLDKELNEDKTSCDVDMDEGSDEVNVPILTLAPHSGTQESPEVDIDKEKKEVCLDEDKASCDVDMDKGSDEVKVQILTPAKHSVTQESFEEYLDKEINEDKTSCDVDMDGSNLYMYIDAVE